MASRYITEAEIGDVDLKSYHSVLLVASPDDASGVEVFTWPRMAPLADRSVPGKLNDYSYLFVVVADPDDLATVERVKNAVIPKR